MQAHPTPAIARATPADLPALLAIQKEAFQSEASLYDAPDTPPLTETLADMQAVHAHASTIILKAEIAGAPVGSIRAVRNGDTCEISRLSVAPRHQRQGIGTALLLACETIHPEARACELYTGHKSTDNIRLYEGLGYRRTKEVPLIPKVTLVYFRKPTAAAPDS